MSNLSAASEIDAWCTKCRRDLGHRVVAMVGPTPKRVICLTCNTTHNYRAPKGAAAAKGAKAPAKARATRAKAEPKAPRETARAKNEAERLREWEQRVAGAAETAFRRYAIDATFKEGDLVMHRKFGEGYVVEADQEGKVYVMFRDQLRTLVHGRT